MTIRPLVKRSWPGQSGAAPGTEFHSLPIADAIRHTHTELSPLFADFLDEVCEQPLWHTAESFAYLAEVEAFTALKTQPWPTLVDRAVHDDLETLNTRITRLVKSIPRRVFGGDVQALTRFYGLRQEHAALVGITLGNRRWSDQMMARSDLVHTASGFRCIEVNLASNLGGWHCGLWGPQLFDFEPLQQFFARRGRPVRLADPTHSLLLYLLRQGLRRYRSTELHFGLLRRGETLGYKPFEQATNETFQALLAGLGGKIRGSFRDCMLDELTVRDGKVFHGDQRMHGLLDSFVGFTGLDIVRCWVHGEVDLYNGPMTPLFNDKRNLALAWELESAGQLEEEERRLLHQTIPWTQRFGGDRVVPGAAAPRTSTELRDRRRDLVLKPADGRAGVGVLVGRETTPETWSKALDQAETETAGEWLVQQFEPSHEMLYFDGRAAVPHTVVWSVFDNGGSGGGSFVRMTPTATAEGVVNSGRGASIGPVFLVDPPEG